MDRIFDAIIVGSGAAGGFVVKTLTESGLDTLVLDAGPRFDPDSGFPPPRVGDRPVRLRAAFRKQPIQARGTSFKGFLRHLYVDDRKKLYTAPKGTPFSWIRGRQVGGRLLTWAGISRRDVPRAAGLGGRASPAS